MNILKQRIDELFTSEWIDKIPEECPYCTSPHFSAVEVDIGEYREYWCKSCLKRFWAKNPSYQGDTTL